MGEMSHAACVHAVRSASSQAPSIKSMIVEAFSQRGHFQNKGLHGPDTLQHIFRCLCRGLNRAKPAAVMQALQNLVVPVGTPFSSYLSEIRLPVGNVGCIVMFLPRMGRCS